MSLTPISSQLIAARRDHFLCQSGLTVPCYRALKFFRDQGFLGVQKFSTSTSYLFFCNELSLNWKWHLKLSLIVMVHSAVRPLLQWKSGLCVMVAVSWDSFQVNEAIISEYAVRPD